jgi:outer membrane protein OmpA-like peptidoglycan-associated protein
MNLRLRTLAAVTGVATLLAACASPPKPVSYVALLESPDGSTGRIVVQGSKGEQLIDQAKTGAPLDGSQPAAPVGDEKLKQDFGAAMAARPLLPERFLLYFESGGAVLTAESVTLLPKIIASVTHRPGVDVSIIGHSDTVGKAEANTTLALKRAQAIADLLREKGLKAAALSVESHGEANLLVKTPDETAEPRNRRVEVSVR